MTVFDFTKQCSQKLAHNSKLQEFVNRAPLVMNAGPHFIVTNLKTMVLYILSTIEVIYEH